MSTPIKLDNGNVLIAGVEYKIVECKEPGCDMCDAQYSNCWCRGGGGDCDLKRNQCYKVVDDAKMVKANNVYNVYGGDNRYISSKGECTDKCVFFKKNRCKLYGLACKGYTPLKPMYKGGV